MLGAKSFLPRIALVPLLYGLIIGLLIGKLWFWTSYNLNREQAGQNVTCLVISKGDVTNKINASKLTWLSKCDNYLIVNFKRTKGASTAGYVNNNLVVSADSSWGALCSTLLLLPRPVQWLIIVPDSVFVVIENLKLFVRNKNWARPAYIGHPLHHYLGQFNALSAGILLSNASLTSLSGRFPESRSCEHSGKYWNNEDVYLGVYLRELGINSQDARDDKGRGRFHGFNINTLLSPGRIFRKSDYHKKAVFPTHEGYDCCSNELITIGTSNADHLLLQYFLMYGINNVKSAALKTSRTVKNNTNEPQWVSTLREIGYTGPTANMSSEEYYKIWAQHMPPEVLAQKMADAAGQN